MRVKLRNLFSTHVGLLLLAGVFNNAVAAIPLDACDYESDDEVRLPLCAYSPVVYPSPLSPGEAIFFPLYLTAREQIGARATVRLWLPEVVNSEASVAAGSDGDWQCFNIAGFTQCTNVQAFPAGARVSLQFHLRVPRSGWTRLVSGLRIDYSVGARGYSRRLPHDLRINSPETPGNHSPVIADGQDFAVEGLADEDLKNFRGQIYAEDWDGNLSGFSIVSPHVAGILSISNDGVVRITDGGKLLKKFVGTVAFDVEVRDILGRSGRGEAEIRLAPPSTDQSPEFSGDDSFHVPRDAVSGQVIGLVHVADPEKQPLILTIEHINPSDAYDLFEFSGQFLMLRDAAAFQAHSSAVFGVWVNASDGVKSATRTYTVTRDSAGYGRTSSEPSTATMPIWLLLFLFFGWWGRGSERRFEP